MPTPPPPPPPPAPPPPPPLPHTPSQQNPRHRGTPARTPIQPPAQPPHTHQRRGSGSHLPYPVYYFVYATLQDPQLAKTILQTPQPPVYRAATVSEFVMGSWGSYKALYDRDSGNDNDSDNAQGRSEEVVTGSAFLVHDQQQETRLARYETRNYRTAECAICFLDDGRTVRGKTFVRAGAEDAERGKFDPGLWEERMGVKLPPGKFGR
ncbi:unnamed protein product [Cyclocybe aegerita]|uniref:Gamma-glutamylcyclotransferase AIG2-like domain-containing protein n=1 Tax=Cyclocybe aegerita TaxID=1973307 RepID=A0A8S0XJF9_CYCAE|nr:unnamed protein product [Cyclocybe aegerita]